jgi:hypothetical protein
MGGARAYLLLPLLAGVACSSEKFTNATVADGGSDATHGAADASNPDAGSIVCDVSDVAKPLTCSLSHQACCIVLNVARNRCIDRTEPCVYAGASTIRMECAADSQCQQMGYPDRECCAVFSGEQTDPVSIDCVPRGECTAPRHHVCVGQSDCAPTETCGEIYQLLRYCRE